MLNLESIRTSRSFSAKLLSTEEATITHWCMGMLLPRCRTLQFSLLNLMTFLLTHLRSFWMAALPSTVTATPPSLVSPANLLRLHSAPSSRGWTDWTQYWSLRNSASHCLQLDPEIQPGFNPPHCVLTQSIHQRFFFNGSHHQRSHWNAGNALCLPLIQEGGPFSTDVYQVGQAWLPHHDAMLTTPNDFVIFTLPGNYFQDQLWF